MSLILLLPAKAQGGRRYGEESTPKFCNREERSPWRFLFLRRGLRGASASGGELANVIQEDGALQCVELRGVLGDLGEERIVHQNGGLVLMALVGVAQQGGDIDLQSPGQPVERGERRHRLAILDLRDVGARHAHAGGQLALREITHVAQIANSGGYLEAVVAGCGLGNQGEWCWSRFGLFDLEAFVAATAQRVRCPELHQTAMIATQNLTLFDRCHHGCHKLSCCGRTQSKDRITRPITEAVMCLD